MKKPAEAGLGLFVFGVMRVLGMVLVRFSVVVCRSF
jgi:hypothetical protein